MKVLVACEFSGVVRDAFAALGHDAWSCDLEPCERAGQHMQRDVREVLRDGWDLMIAHPPCTHLAVSGARWFAEKRREQQHALDFFARLLLAPIPRIAVENPISVVSSWIRRPDQVIQPWQYGHGETKATALWLVNLPKLRPTQVVNGRTARVHRMPPGPNRARERSRTYEGIARAMAEQWGGPATVEIAA
jgi:hypothetical protein